MSAIDGKWVPPVPAHQLAAIIESASDAIVGKRLDGTITSWNSAAAQLFGYTAAEITGQSVTLLMPQDRLHEEAGIVARLQAGERIPPFETVRRRKDGALIDVEVSAAPIRDSAGAVVGASKVVRDIGSVVALRQREQRLSRFLHALTRASRATARPTSDQELFAELCRICVELGGALACCLIEGEGEAVSVKAHSGLSMHAARTVAAELFRNQRATRALAQGEPVVVTDIADWFDLACAARLNPQGTAAAAAVPFKRGSAIAGTLAVLAIDVHFFDAVALELLRELASDLSHALTNRARDLEFQGIVESAMDAIIAVDANHRILRFNQSASELFLWPRAEAVGQPIERIIPHRFRENHGQLMDRFADTETLPRRMGAARPLMGLRTDGTEVPIEATVSRFGSGPDLRMIVVIRDVSPLRMAESALIAQREAEAANRAKSVFLSHMSHELRTPLNAVLGFTQVMMSDPALADAGRQRTQLGHIQAAGRHLHVLISDLLDMARIEAGLLSVQRGAVSLDEALDDVLGILAPMASAAGIELIRQDFSDRPPVLAADPTRLRQVLSNLISNGIKYNRPGGSVRIEVQAALEGITIQVMDSGLGMTRQQLGRLFEPYNRLGQEKSSISGTGIGLVVTKNLVELMGGTLQFSSVPDRGTCVDVTLPNASGDLQRVDAPVTLPGRLEASELSGTVLSIEDNEVNQLLLESLFLRWPKVRLVQAADGASGLKLAGSLQPDLILLDMHLPDMSGLQFMEAMVASPLMASLKVIALSANAMREDVELALRSGIADYMTKPLDVEQFSHKLRTVLCEPAMGSGERIV